MAKSSLLPGFKGLGGSAKKVLNEKTGEILSRRQYAKLKHGGMTNEALTKLNKEFYSVESISRPARGRKSIQKLAPEFKKTVAQVRLDAEKEKKAREAKIKAEKKAHTKIERLNKKQTVKPPKFTKSLLKAGAKARRISFNTYEEFHTLLLGARSSGVVFNYSLGMVGISTRDPLNPGLQAPNVIPGQHIKETISKEYFYEEMRNYLESVKSYFQLLHYYVQFAFTEKYYEQKAKDAGFYRNEQGRWIKPDTKNRRSGSLRGKKK